MTTTRWKVGIKNDVFFEDSGILVCRCDTNEAAHQIVREHNAHAAMVEALESAMPALQELTNVRAWGALITQQAFKNRVTKLQAALRLANEKGG